MVEQLVAVSGLEEVLVQEALDRFCGDADEALLYLLSDHAVSQARAGQACAQSADHPPFTGSEVESEESEESELSGDSDGEACQPEPEGLEAPYWGELPPDVMHVLGHWLAEHLGKYVERQIAPKYLHPLRSLADLFDRGHRRCSATLGMLRAIQACRQTCRIWRDDISYHKIGTLVPASCAPCVLWTWWAGSRVIRSLEWYRRNPRPRGTVEPAYAGVPPDAPVPRCPACRKICKPRDALCNFMKACGLGRWESAIRKALKVQTIAELRQLTVQDLMTGLAELYSEQSLSNIAPQFVQNVRATPVRWSEESLENTPCQECNQQTPQHYIHEAEDVLVPGCQVVGLLPSQKTICVECQMLFCGSCAGRVYRDGRPQTPSAIFPPDFSARFSNLRTLSLCDLLLPSLPPLLADCATLRTLDVSGNSLNELPGWLSKLTMLQHLDFSEQRRGLRSGPPTLHKDAVHPGSWSLPSTLVTLRMKNLGLAVIPLAVRDLKCLQMLDMSGNALFCTAEQPVRFSTAGSALSPNAEYNLSAASWLADRALLPALRIVNLSSSVLQIGEATLNQAQRWAEGLDRATQVLAFAWFATSETDCPTLTGTDRWQARDLIVARNAAPEVNSLEAFAGDHWFHTFVGSGGTLLLESGDFEADLELQPELEL